MGNNHRNKWNIKIYDCITSTQDYAYKEIKNNINANFLSITAYSQISGKARKSSRIWQSPIGNLYNSSIVKIENYSLHQLSFASAIAVKNTLTQIGIKNIKLKYPNDVLVNGKKISGILIEKVDNFAVIGTGINIKYFPTENINFPATSILNEGFHIPILDVLNIYLEKLYEVIMLFNQNKFEKITNEWLKFAYKLNEIIIVKDDEKEITGKFIGLDSNGFLEIETNNKNIYKIFTGDVTY